MVQPATVLGWHRALVHRRWAAFGRRRGPGRPKLPTECRELVLQLASRRILFTACSEHPGGAWAAQQARNLAWRLQEAKVRPCFLMHDRDSNFPAAFDAVF